MSRVWACIPAFNEGAVLEGCLQSFIEHVDGIIAIDCPWVGFPLDGPPWSTDETIEILRRYNANIIQPKRQLTHVEVWNLFLENIPEGDWLFNIEADERCEGDVAGAMNFVKNSEKRLFLVEITGTYPGWKPRFFKPSHGWHFRTYHWCLYDENGYPVTDWTMVYVPHGRIESMKIRNMPELRPPKRDRQRREFQRYWIDRGWIEDEKLHAILRKYKIKIKE